MPRSVYERNAPPEKTPKPGDLERYAGLILDHVNGGVLQCFHTLGTEPLSHAIKHVPHQRNSWSCGINSSARFLAMLGKPLRDYVAHHNAAPRHHLGPYETGPGTVWLVNHMQRNRQTEGLDVFGHMSDDWGPQQCEIDASLTAGKPVMVLIEMAGRRLHWVPLVGRGHGNDGDYIAVDTNRQFLRIFGGGEGLRRRMDLSQHSVHKVPMRDDRIAAYNSIVAKAGPLRQADGRLATVDHSTAEGLCGDQNGVANMFESVGELLGNAFDAVGGGAQAAGNAASEVGSGVVDAAKVVGNGAEDAAKVVGNGVEDAAKAVGNGVESAASAVASFWKSIF